jgi:hypothetical protein
MMASWPSSLRLIMKWDKCLHCLENIFSISSPFE